MPIQCPNCEIYHTDESCPECGCVIATNEVQTIKED